MLINAHTGLNMATGIGQDGTVHFVLCEVRAILSVACGPFRDIGHLIFPYPPGNLNQVSLSVLHEDRMSMT